MAFFEGLKMTGGYGTGPDIINSCSVDVNRGEIVSILGPNGAGKSTAMKALLGLINLKSGAVVINGKDISKLSPQDRVREGISFVPQTKNVFAGMTVEENLEMGAYLRDDNYQNIIEEKSIGLRTPKRPPIINQIYYLGIGLFCLGAIAGLGTFEQGGVFWFLVGLGVLIQLVFLSELLNQLYQINCNTFRQYEGFKFTQKERQKK